MWCFLRYKHLTAPRDMLCRRFGRICYVHHSGRSIYSPCVPNILFISRKYFLAPGFYCRAVGVQFLWIIWHWNRFSKSTSVRLCHLSSHQWSISMFTVAQLGFLAPEASNSSCRPPKQIINFKTNLFIEFTFIQLRKLIFVERRKCFLFYLQY